eukprot:scaffold46486_cov28-Tisochrysis_lutea.AAC.1
MSHLGMGMVVGERFGVMERELGRLGRVRGEGGKEERRLAARFSPREVFFSPLSFGLDAPPRCSVAVH